MFSGLLFYLKNNWARYYLETEVAITLIQSIALSVFLARLYALIVKKLKHLV
jgi:hypothetical protein